MLYIQFYQKAVWPIGTDLLIEATGDRSVVILDARRRYLSGVCGIAETECVARGYEGYRLFKGESFTRSEPYGVFHRRNADNTFTADEKVA